MTRETNMTGYRKWYLYIFKLSSNNIHAYNSVSQEKYKCIKDNVKHPIVDLIINDCCPEFTVVSPLVHITFMMHTSSCSNHKGTMKISFTSTI